MRAFRSSSLSAKLSVPVVLLALVSGALMLFAWRGIDHIAASMIEVIDGDAARQRWAIEVGARLNEAAIYEKNVLIEKREERQKQLAEEWRNAHARTLDAIEKLAAANRFAGVEDSAGEAALKQAADAYFEVSAKVVEAGLDGDEVTGFLTSNGEGNPLRLEASALIQKQVEAITSDFMQAKDDTAHNASRHAQWLAGIGGSALAICFALNFASLLFGLARPMKRITATATTLAEGKDVSDLVDLHRQDQLGALARAFESFRGAVAARRALEAERAEETAARARRADAIEQVIAQFETAGVTLLERLDRAASTMDETATFLTEEAERAGARAEVSASTAHQTAAHVASTAEATRRIAEIANMVGSEITEAAKAAELAASQASRGDEAMRALAEVGGRIRDSARMIAGFATQTNLLALNATIEAARAGDAGKGFAVVAGEVKALATESAKAAEDVASQVDAITRASQAVGQVINEVGQAIGRVNDIAGSVARSAREQEHTTSELSSAGDVAARGAADLAASVEETARGTQSARDAAARALQAASELHDGAEALRREVKGFLQAVRAA